MELQYQNEIGLIDNCPLDNIKGEKILFRCVENPITSNSFKPLAALEKPKYKDNCLAWGLSFFIDIKSATDILKNLSKKKNQKVNYRAVACGKLTDNDGIKHSSQNKNHYTFYPKIDFDFNGKFTIVEDNGK